MAVMNNQQNPQMMQVMPNQGGYYQNGNWQMPMAGTVNQPQTQYVNQPNTQPIYQQPQPQPVNQQPVQQYVNSDRNWALGDTAAKAFLVARNSEAVIWDTEQPVIYIKTVDANGKPSMMYLDYTIRQPEQSQQMQQEENAKMDDLNSKVDKLYDMFEQFKGFMENQVQQQPTKTYKPSYNKKEVAN